MVSVAVIVIRSNSDSISNSNSNSNSHSNSIASKSLRQRPGGGSVRAGFAWITMVLLELTRAPKPDLLEGLCLMVAFNY